jgi:hypothetical protein
VAASGRRFPVPDHVAALAPPIRATEARKYAELFIGEDDSLSYFIGCSNWDTNRALVFAIEAARLLCCSEAAKITWGVVTAVFVVLMIWKSVIGVPEDSFVIFGAAQRQAESRHRSWSRE